MVSGLSSAINKHRTFSSAEKNVALHLLGIQLVTFKFFPIPGAGEKLALIRLRFKVNLEDTWQLGLMKGHFDG